MLLIVEDPLFLRSFQLFAKVIFLTPICRYGPMDHFWSECQKIRKGQGHFLRSNRGQIEVKLRSSSATLADFGQIWRKYRVWPHKGPWCVWFFKRSRAPRSGQGQPFYVCTLISPRPFDRSWPNLVGWWAITTQVSLIGLFFERSRSPMSGQGHTVKSYTLNNFGP